MFGTVVLFGVLFVPAADPTVRVRAQAPWPHSTGPVKGFVVRSAAELLAASPDRPKEGLPTGDAERQATAVVAKALNVKEIDWKSEMLVVVRLVKVHPRGIQVGRLDVREGELTVHYDYWAPVAAREDDPDPVPTDVAVILLVDRFDGKVKFAGDMRTPK